MPAHDGNPAEAQDLTQDAFLQLFRKIKSFRGESSLSTWLHRLTVNIVLMRFRRKRHPEVSLDEPAAAGDEAEPLPFEIGEPDLRVRGTLDRVMLDRAIERLPAGYKVMFILHDIQGYAHEERGNPGVLDRQFPIATPQGAAAHARIADEANPARPTQTRGESRRGVKRAPGAEVPGALRGVKSALLESSFLAMTVKNICLTTG